ncbi:MepB family protein [Leptospira ellisii]|uniref:MepB family protein n=1 Tax=Leptospira ellisii TaxID=2023197 RepID=A0A2N0BA49_9LEPT|nr:MepB family protein [Leptospira ellisii]MDV6235175.1 MepB family protein [Leptospira ellisii]PJZ93419.1 MepB protein [Leptospira ellisii]
MQKKRSVSNALPPSLREINSLFSKNCGLEIEDYRIEKESSDYNAAFFSLDGQRIVFRSAKITPKKIGMFVTLWKRNKNGITIPFHKSDPVDLIVVEVKKSDRIGHFLFNKKILMDQGIISSVKEGKRGFRIYPPWETTANRQAAASQIWQSLCFFEHKRPNTDDRTRLKELTGLNVR